MKADSLDLPDMLKSWCRQLRRDRESEHTVRVYRAAVEAFLTYCTDTGHPAELTKANVIGWLDTQHG